MGYLSIDNLYKNQEILMFKECYALEKLHGTSAHVAWKAAEKSIRFFTGEGHEHFVKLFNEAELKEKFAAQFPAQDVTLFGENFAGKIQGMKATYGDERKFKVFDVRIGEYCWLNVPAAEKVAQDLGFGFVHYVRCSTDLAALDFERDKPSTEAMLAGCGEKPSEGVVLRPLIELKKNNGERIIAKHKRAEFRETSKVRQVSPEQLEVLSAADEIAAEWVTPMRLQHVLQKTEVTGIEDTPKVNHAMLEDVKKESVGEIEWSKEAEKAILRATAKLFKQYLIDKVRSEHA